MRNVIAAVAAVVATTTLFTTALEASPRDRFIVLDANADGVLTQRELNMVGCKISPNLFKQIDSNGNGEISLSEYRRFSRVIKSQPGCI